MHLGFRPPIDSDLDFTTIETFLNRQSVPRDFATHVKVSLVVAKYTHLLVRNTNEATGLSLVRLIDSDLDSLRASYEVDEPGAERVEFAVLTVRLHFHALLLTMFALEPASRSITLRTALAAALRIISIAAARSRTADAERGSPGWIRVRRTMTKSYYLGVTFATIFLLKFFHLGGGAERAEREAAASHVGLAQDVFSSLSVEARDEYGRAAGVFKWLARSAQIGRTHV